MQAKRGTLVLHSRYTEMYTLITLITLRTTLGQVRTVNTSAFSVQDTQICVTSLQFLADLVVKYDHLKTHHISYTTDIKIKLDGDNFPKLLTYKL